MRLSEKSFVSLLCDSLSLYAIQKLFDLLDEQALTKGQLRDFFRILFGDNLMDGVPDPEADWKAFCSSIQRLVDNEKKAWNPITKKMQPWVDMKRLKKDYGGGWFW